MGNWNLHLEYIELMLPFFHAAGHFNYAIDPIECENFTKKEFFTAQRTDKFFGGIFSNQTIEQTLMRAMSVEGGPFKQGATASVVFKWIKCVIYS